MPLGSRLRRLLNRNRAEYSRSVHRPADTARQVAYEEGISPHRMAKTVVFHSDNGYGMAVIPADSFVDLGELSFVLALKNVRLATEDELRKLFPDSDVGAMPPFGNLYGIPTFVDANLAEEDVIAFNAGSHQDVVYMRFADFKRLAHPTTAFFAGRNATAGAR
jgi:Ala-tRNA(Pro) deacylase